jgi:Ca-activated chloride channel homolog
MPLKSSDYHLDIVNSITNVTLTQSYLNPTEQFLDVEYSFPIHPEACVYRFVAEFGTTRIEGVVKEKGEAKKEYEQAVREGKRAAYGELNAERKDILNLKIGNVPPTSSVRIEIAYLQ